MNSIILTIAIQKDGRLTDDTFEFLRRSGLEFESYKQKLFSSCRNFPLKILFVRDNDIPDYVSSGAVDLGILGQNLLYEERPPNVRKLLNLRFGFCSLCVSIPKESRVQNISELDGKTIATSYPNSTINFLKKMGLSATMVKIGGSVEIAPALGVADAISDLLSTGSTLALNDLKPLVKIYDSEAVLIANEKSTRLPDKKFLLNNLMTRFKGVLSAKNYKLVQMNIPQENMKKLKKVLPSLKSAQFTKLTKSEIVPIQTVIKEDALWETMKTLKTLGATEIFVLPIEKIIN